MHTTTDPSVTVERANGIHRGHTVRAIFDTRAEAERYIARRGGVIVADTTCTCNPEVPGDCRSYGCDPLCPTCGDEPCLRGTVGCSVDHADGTDRCETW